jgi:hypothetical protein
MLYYIIYLVILSCITLNYSYNFRRTSNYYSKSKSIVKIVESI